MTDHDARDPADQQVDGGNIVSNLLKAPQRVSAAIAEQRGLLRSTLVLLATALACHAVFGFAVGLFGGFGVSLMDTLKAPLVMLFSLLLCMPSLYVFACVAGAPVTLGQAFALGSAAVAMIGLLLVGLAPVAWLFAVSTTSIPFVVVLTLLIWLTAVAFADRFVAGLRQNDFFSKQGGIRAWFLILVVVSLQMATCMRPMLMRPEQGWWQAEKKFFLSHFGSTFELED